MDTALDEGDVDAALAAAREQESVLALVLTNPSACSSDFFFYLILGSHAINKEGNFQHRRGEQKNTTQDIIDAPTTSNHTFKQRARPPPT